MRKNRERDEEELDEYIPSESDDQYSDNERILLEKVRKGHQEEDFDSADEVFGIKSSSDTDEEDIASDIEGQGGDDDDLPDVKAWGKRKKTYYNTDYVDPDYGGFDDKDVEAAELEEQEARDIQKRLLEQLDETDFSLSLFSQGLKEKDGDRDEEIIKADTTKLSKRQKLALVQKESPEFAGLVSDFKEKMTEVRDKLAPVITLIKTGKIPHSSASDFITTMYQLILNYCTNIAFYLLLKARKTSVQCHPVIRRLFQYRELLKQLEPVYRSKILPQIDIVLQRVNSGMELTVPNKDDTSSHQPTSKRKLKLLTQSGVVENKKCAKTETPQAKKLKVNTLDSDTEQQDIDNSNIIVNEGDTSGSESEQSDEDANMDEEEPEGKRSITYEMAKNRGLTPYRRKELRNPRVKHRMKFRKAIIRRKGQVRAPRKETQKYGGEISGIKASVTRSIKLK